MILIPYERITIKTALCADEVLQRLEANVAPERLFSMWRKKTKIYQGKIDGFHFEVTRIIEYRSSPPLIKGVIKSETSGSSILITMYPDALAIAMMSLVLVGAGLVFLFSLINFLFSAIATGALNSPLLDILSISAGTLVFGYLAFLGIFKLESVNSKYFFRKLFLADQVDEFTIKDLFKAA